jgi:hypothetical protein
MYIYTKGACKSKCPHQLTSPPLPSQLFEATVSPDIPFYFRVYKFKSTLSVRPLIVLKFVYLVIL